MTVLEKHTVSALLVLAFEAGRNYEQLYLDLDLYNSIDLSGLINAQEKGAMFNLKNVSVENLVKGKFSNLTDTEMRKISRLKELRRYPDELINKFL